MTKKQICVFCASSKDVDEAYYNASRELGRLIATKGWGCVNGAGERGLMRAVSDGCLDAGGEVTGIIPKFMVDNGWHYDRLSNLIITADMHQRKEQMAEIADAIVALPGGCGTIEELMEMLTWRQLGIIDTPIVVLNTSGFYDPLLAMIDRCVQQGFMKASHARLCQVAATPQETVDIICQTQPQQVESKY